jgi:hypothetical protein
MGFKLGNLLYSGSQLSIQISVSPKTIFVTPFNFTSLYDSVLSAIFTSLFATSSVFLRTLYVLPTSNYGINAKLKSKLKYRISNFLEGYKETFALFNEISL